MTGRTKNRFDLGSVDCAFAEGGTHTIWLETEGEFTEDLLKWTMKVVNDCGLAGTHLCAQTTTQSIKALGGYTCEDITMPLYDVGIPVVVTKGALFLLSVYVNDLMCKVTDTKNYYRLRLGRTEPSKRIAAGVYEFV